jgi:hypothetical protein
VIDPGEQCDQSNLNGATCGSQGFAAGVPLTPRRAWLLCQVLPDMLDEAGAAIGDMLIRERSRRSSLSI